MFIDLRRLASGTELEADVCVIGAGAAGITLAREFIGTPWRVCVLESGGTEGDGLLQDLHRGFIVGTPYPPLELTRARFLGGTTNLWTGACLPLDESDFRLRDWVPYSSWPITRASLEPFYVRAHAVCEIAPGNYNYVDGLWKALGIPPLPIDPQKLELRCWQYSPPTRFGEAYRAELMAAGNIQIFVYANVVNLQALESGSALDHVDVATLEGKSAKVRARVYVLATGGIENARLLLGSDRVEKNGLGNRRDLVGRFFMEHTYYQSGFVVPSDAQEFRRRFDQTRAGRNFALMGLRLSEAIQREEKVLNSCALLDFQAAPDNAGLLAKQRLVEAIEQGRLPDDFGRMLLDVLLDLDDVLLATYGERVHGDSRRYEEKGSVLFVQSEQAPDPANRVRLSTKQDALGQRRSVLERSIGGLDKRTIDVTARCVGSELGRLGLGRMRLSEWIQREEHAGWLDGLQWGHHHMGTTRMSSDESSGVVNADCRMHSVQNLFVAGSSVFATGGFANPTLTIVALALRLADHLKRELAG